MRPIDILTGEITIEVTGIVGVSLDRIIMSFRKRFLSFYIYLLLIWLFMFFLFFYAAFQQQNESIVKFVRSLPFWKRWNFGRFYVYAPTNTYRCVDLEEQLFCIFIAVIKLDIDTFIFILQHIFISQENFTMKHQTYN